MIYLDTSVALAYIFAEDRHPPDHLWSETLVSSRLFTYEIWTRLHARGLTDTYGDAARSMIGQISLLEMTPNVLEWINDSIPIEVNLRTLDAIHLATCIFLINQGQKVAVATYDLRMSAAASNMNIPLFDL